MRAPLLILGTLLLGVAGYLAPARPSLAAQGRNLVRPAFLPFLWEGLANARRNGTPEEYAARGRLLMQFLPGWTDGYNLVAGNLAFDASLAQTDPNLALDRILAAIDYLETAREQTQTAKARETLRRTQARLLYIRTSSNPAIAAAFQARRGSSPVEWVKKYLQDIPRLATSRHLRSELCFTLIEGLAIDIRLGFSGPHLLRSLSSIETLLAEEKDAPEIRTWRGALQKLRSYLQNPDDETYAALQDEPFLDSIRTAFVARKNALK